VLRRVESAVRKASTEPSTLPKWNTERTEQPVNPEVPVALTGVESFRSEWFPRAGPRPWLDRPDADAAISRRERIGEITPFEAALCRKWSRDGYVIVEKMFADEMLDYVWSAYDGAIDRGVLKPPPEIQFPGDKTPGRLLDPHLSVPEIADLMHDQNLGHVVNMLLGAESAPFQSISGHKASQQAIHGDSIHMTTYPEGYLVAMWIAFEDIHPGSGPLEFYPGSHRLPTVYSADVGIPEEAFKARGYRDFDDKYTPAIREVIATRGLEARHFHAGKGDVLFWHANLLHGGSARTDFLHTRRALVFHFFAKGCICYHDLAASVSRVHVSA
jgi:hypothetical protein